MSHSKHIDELKLTVLDLSQQKTPTSEGGQMNADVVPYQRVSKHQHSTK